MSMKGVGPKKLIMKLKKWYPPFLRANGKKNVHNTGIMTNELHRSDVLIIR